MTTTLRGRRPGSSARQRNGGREKSGGEQRGTPEQESTLLIELTFILGNSLAVRPGSATGYAAGCPTYTNPRRLHDETFPEHLKEVLPEQGFDPRAHIARDRVEADDSGVAGRDGVRIVTRYTAFKSSFRGRRTRCLT